MLYKCIVVGCYVANSAKPWGCSRIGHLKWTWSFTREFGERTWFKNSRGWCHWIFLEHVAFDWGVRLYIDSKKSLHSQAMLSGLCGQHIIQPSLAFSSHARNIRSRCLSLLPTNWKHVTGILNKTPPQRSQIVHKRSPAMCQVQFQPFHLPPAKKPAKAPKVHKPPLSCRIPKHKLMHAPSDVLRHMPHGIERTRHHSLLL